MSRDTRDTAEPAPRYAVVIPTLGRHSLNDCLTALASARGPRPRHVVLVDDRAPHVCDPLPVDIPTALRGLVDIVPGPAAGPAAARNTGWRATDEPWVAFLDDDVVPGPGWAADLRVDLDAAHAGTGGVQGRIRVPLPADRRPTDWERGTASLATARWITADMAYRRAALEDVGGFDERFPRAFREDADLALRVLAAGWRLSVGVRETTHPVRTVDRAASVRAQAGNADDVLMSRLHGRDWWSRAGAPRGRLPAHLAVTGAAVGALALTAARRPRGAALCAALWLGGTADFTLRRVLPGPRDWQETLTMSVTSVVIPPVATAHWLRGLLLHRAVPPWPPPATAGHVRTVSASGTGAPSSFAATALRKLRVVGS